MFRTPSSLIFLLIFSSLWCLRFSYLVKKYEIFDLISKNASIFAQEADAWNITNNLTTYKYTQCDGRYLLAGYGVLNFTSTITRTYQILQPHKSLYITAFFSLLDDWGLDEKIIFQVRNSMTTFFNEEIISLMNANSLLITKGTVCGGTTQDNVDIFVIIQTPHTGRSVDFIIDSQTSISSSRGHLGLRNLTVLISNNTVSAPDHCYFDDTMLNYYEPHNCGCGVREYYSTLGCYDCQTGCFACRSSSDCLACENNYYYTGTSCAPCSSSCATCFGQNSNECLSCNNGSYLVPGNTCNSTCPSPYVIEVIEDVNYCNFPCNVPQFYYANGSCEASCPSSFNQVIYSTGEKFCHFKCQPGQFFYSKNNTCLSSCPSPWKSRTEGGIYSYCEHPCPSNGPNYYLYWNDSCLTTCDSPLKSKTQADILICDYICNNTQYLYPSQQCQDSCFPPLKPKIEGDRNFCYNPCSSSNSYLFRSGNCLSSCLSPLIPQSNSNGQFCLEPCPTDQPYYNLTSHQCVSTCPQHSYIITYPLGLYQACSPRPIYTIRDGSFIDKINIINSISGIFSDVALTAAGILAPRDPGSVSAGILAKMLQYIKYLNISYPYRLESTFQPHNSIAGPFGVGPHMPDALFANLESKDVPPRFSKFHVNQSFLINFWDGLAFLLFILTFLGLIVLFEIISIRWNKKPSLPLLIKKVRVVFQNFFLMQFYNSYGEILLYFGLEARAPDFDSFGSAMSFIISLLFVILGIVILFKHTQIIRRYQNLRKSRSNGNIMDDFSKSHEGTQLLYKHFKDNSFMNQGFLFFYVIRSCMFNLVLSLVSDQPLAQTIIIFCMTIALLVFIAYKRPFKSFVNFLQQIVCETLFLVVNTCLLVLAALDIKRDEGYEDVRDNIGDAIIFSNLIFRFIPPIFLGIKVLQVIVEFLRDKQKQRTRKRESVFLVSNHQARRDTLRGNRARNSSNISGINLESSFQTNVSFQTDLAGGFEVTDALKQKREADHERFKRMLNSEMSSKKRNTLDVNMIDSSHLKTEGEMLGRREDLLRDIAIRSKSKWSRRRNTENLA